MQMKSSGRFGSAPAPSLGPGLRLRNDFVEPDTAVLFDEGQRFVEHIELGRAAYSSALPHLRHQLGRDEAAQVEGEGGGGRAEPGTNFADGKPLWPWPDNQAD